MLKYFDINSSESKSDYDVQKVMSMVNADAEAHFGSYDVTKILLRRPYANILIYTVLYKQDRVITFKT